MPFSTQFTVTQASDGSYYIVRDISDYAGYGGKSAFTNRQLTIEFFDGTTQSYSPTPFSFANYPDDILTIDSQTVDYSLRITLSVEDAPTIVLTTIAVTSYTANKGSTNNIAYVLKIENLTTSAYNYLQTIATTIFGQAIGNDIAALGIKIWTNTAPNLTGSPTQITAFNPSGSFSDVINATSLGITIPASSTLYVIFTFDIHASATTDNTLFFNGATSPLVLTITGSPLQTNSQTNVSPTITVGT